MFNSEVQSKHELTGAALALDLLRTMHELGQDVGLKIRLPSQESLEKFALLPLQRQSNFLTSLEIYAPVFECQIKSITAGSPEKITAKQEREHLTYMADRMDIELNKEVLKAIDKGDVVEIYNTDSIQVYRNLEFFRTTNYSLLDIVSCSWQTLWERPTQVVEMINQRVSEVMTSEDTAPKPFQITDHIIREKYLGHTQALAIHTKKIARVNYRDRKDAFGFFVNMNVQIIATGSEAQKVGFT